VPAVLAVLVDLRHAVRMVRAQPGLAAAAILALGLGVGLTTLMWSIMYGAMLRPLPFAEADRYVWVARAFPSRGLERAVITFADYDAMRRRQTSFAGLAAYASGTVNVSGDGAPAERFQGTTITPNGLAMPGVRPLLGRLFTADEGTAGGPLAVILGYDAWRTRFAGDSTAVGRTLRINGVSAEIVGVMPRGFRFPVEEDLWLPMRGNPDRGTPGGRQWVTVYGKLAPAVGLARARADLGAVEAALAREFPRTNAGARAVVEPFTEIAIGKEPRAMLVAMMGAVVAVLLIACANVASLLLARAAARTRDVAVRTALGAPRWRIASQLLAESLVLAVAGAALGLGLATVGLHAFTAITADLGKPFWIFFGVDGPILVFVTAVTAVAAVASGLLPVLQATGSRIHEVLKDESRGAGSWRAGRFTAALVVLEIALSCGLLICAGFMIQSVVTRSRFDYGVPTHGVFTASIGLFGPAYDDHAGRARFWNTVADRLSALPGHRGVALMTSLPGLRAARETFRIEGAEYASEGDYPAARLISVSPGYFGAFGLAALHGRVFGSGDVATSEPVAVVSAGFARSHFPGGAAVGRRVSFGWGWLRIVGVIPDVWAAGRDDATPEALMTPLAQSDNRVLSLAVASSGADPVAFTGVVRREIAAVDPDQPLYNPSTLQQQIYDDGWVYRVFGTLFLVFGAAALCLATIGVYGVMSFAVTRRTREVGVRKALGADDRDVLRLFLRHAAPQIGAGVALGVGLGLLLAGGLRIALFQVDTGNPWMVAGAAVLMILTGVAATLVPARRAMKVDPVVALRYE
jgi:predicted permease